MAPILVHVMCRSTLPMNHLKTFNVQFNTQREKEGTGKDSYARAGAGEGSRSNDQMRVKV